MKENDTELREAWLLSTLEELRDGPPPDLAHRVMEAARLYPEGATPSRTAREARPSVGLAAALLVGGLAVVGGAYWSLQLTANGSAAQDPDRGDSKGNPMGCGAFFPLKMNAQWSYGVRVGDQPPETTTWRVTSQRRIGGEMVFQITSRRGDRQEFWYWAVDDRSLYRYGNLGSRASQPGASPTARVRVLAGPVGIEPQWKWDWRPPQSWFSPPLPVAGRVTSRDLQTWSCTARLTHVAETVDVPAGEFETVHVSVKGRSEDGTGMHEDSWYARGVGLVRRRIEYDMQLPVEWELESYRPGSEPIEPELLLRRLLQEDTGLAARGAPDTVQWIDLGDEAWLLSSRFARLKWSESVMLVRVDREGAGPFDPTDEAAFTRLFTDEGLWVDQPGGDLFTHSLALMARLVARLGSSGLGHEIVAGPEVIKISALVTEQRREGEAMVEVRDGDGNRTSLHYRFVALNREVLDLDVRPARR